MSAPISRRALQLLPPFATTGIGSLPHSQLELALQMALQVDVPYLPQLPAGNPSEFMIPGALDGLPGLRYDAEGLCTVDVFVAQRTVAGPAICALAKASLRLATSHRNGFHARQACGEGSKASSSPEVRAASTEAPNASR